MKELTKLQTGSGFQFVMAGLVPAIHAFGKRKTWMPGTRPGMTVKYRYLLASR